MRDTKIKVLYYPDSFLAEATLKKSILLFDELHLMDRPSFSFAKGKSGLIGMPSPFRNFESLFRDSGFPLYVHSALGGPTPEELYEQVKADLGDMEFFRRFQLGLKTSPSFRGFHIPAGDYGGAGNQDNVTEKVVAVNLATDLQNYKSAIDLFEDPAVRPYDFSSPLSCAKTLTSFAVHCSVKLNFAMDKGADEGFVPLADANPYHDLLGAKYARAVNKLEPAKNKIQVTDLTFAIFDELISAERLEKLTIQDIIHYRKKSEKAREAFLEYLGVLQAKQARIGSDGDYAGLIAELVTTEILPAARRFRNEIEKIGDTLFGTITKGAISYLGASGAVTLFGALSWANLLALAAPVGAYIANAAIDNINAQRAARRECSISYILSLDQ
jgi:hypothetical protein